MSVMVGRLVTGMLAVLVSFCAAEAGKAAGAPGLVESLAVAGSFLENPAAALRAADEVISEKVVPAAQTKIEDQESPPLFEPPPESTAVPEESAVPEPTPCPEPPPGMGRIKEVQYPQGSGNAYIPLSSGTIKNRAGLPAEQIQNAVAAGLPFEIEQNSAEPQVLIMHTHTTESYEANEVWFDPAYTSRSTDESIGVVAVGAAIAQELNAAGINTIQDTTLHDYPSYNGSYGRSNETVRRNLEAHPSIKVVLDVHRDAVENDGQRVSAVTEINGKKAAQIMVICGVDKGGNLPNFEKNLGFAAAWESAMESHFPGLTRPVLLDYRYYNQDLTTGSLLIEVGSHGNTTEQAVYSGQLVGQALAALFTG